MAYARVALVAVLLCTAIQVAQAAPRFANMMFNFQEGEGFTITWANAVGPVTLKVVSGDKVVLTIDTDDTGDQYTWTPEGLPSGTYALLISDSTGETRSAEWDYKSSVVDTTSAETPTVTLTRATSPPQSTTPTAAFPDHTTTSNSPTQTVATTAAATAAGGTSSTSPSEPSTQPSGATTLPLSSGAIAPQQSASPTTSGGSGGNGRDGSQAADAGGSTIGGSDNAGLGMGAKIGIGVGAGVGGLVALGALALLIYRRGKAAGQKGSANAPGLGENGIAELGAPEHKPRPELGGVPVSEMYATFGEVPELSDAHHEEYARKLAAVELSAVPAGYFSGVPVEKG